MKATFTGQKDATTPNKINHASFKGTLEVDVEDLSIMLAVFTKFCANGDRMLTEALTMIVMGAPLEAHERMQEKVNATKMPETVKKAFKLLFELARGKKTLDHELWPKDNKSDSLAPPPGVFDAMLGIKLPPSQRFNPN